MYCMKSSQENLYVDSEAWRNINYYTLSSDDDLESGYLSPGSDSSRSQTLRVQNSNNFTMLEHKVRMLKQNSARH